MSDDTKTGCAIMVLLAIFASFPAWLTHVIVCIQEELWGFLIAGALLAPIGIIHGFMIWFGLA